MLGAARPYLLRILSHSGALTTVVPHWARSRRIGSSRFVSLGDSADVDVADVLDNLGRPPYPRPARRPSPCCPESPSRQATTSSSSTCGNSR
ncbi:hypothetical protein [Cupriavidus sp. YAF13]|uniref:hypothetical protein n=1 Tax=Cupriavidus sp. YAF13 TaxID=3233075 RepID=UPI003F917A7F